MLRFISTMNITRIIKNIFFLLVAIFSCLTLIVVTAGVTSGAEELAPFNNLIENTILHLRSPLLTSVMLFVTNVGSPFVLSMLSIVLAIILVWHRDTYDTLLYMVSITLSIAVFIIMKNSLGIPRPIGSLVTELTGWSFPSGHATVATTFFFVGAYSFFDWFRSWVMKIFLVVFAVFGASIVAFSRVYLGAHFALDVLAGIALGLTTVSVTILIFNIFLSEREWWRRRVRSL